MSKSKQTTGTNQPPDLTEQEMDLLHSAWLFPEFETALLDRCTLIEPFNINEADGPNSELWAYLYGLNDKTPNTNLRSVSLFFLLYGENVYRIKNLSEVLAIVAVLRKEHIFDKAAHEQFTNTENK